MIPGLDGLRAIAFLMVLGTHSGIFDFGWAGVQFFFVISGFLITGVLLRMKESLSARQYFYKFYGRRILRIFPLYFLYLFILTILIWQSGLMPWTLFRNEIQNVVQPQLHYAYFYMYDFFHAGAEFESTRFLRHFWSLSVEEQFYVFWPLVLFLTPKEKIRNVFLGMIALAPILRLSTYLIYSNHLLPALLDDPYMAVYVLPFSHIDAFAMGAYISCYPLPSPRKQLAIMVYAVPLLGFLTQYLSTGTIQLDTAGYEFTMFTAYKFVWGYSVLNYLFALVIHSVHQTKLFTNILDHFIPSYLGKISYGLYVYHSPIVWFLLVLQLRYGDRLPFTLYLGQVRTFFVVMIITVIISSLSFHLFEKPINDLKDKYFPLEPS